MKKFDLKTIFIILIFMFINLYFVYGLRNPSVVYCQELGYISSTKTTSEGKIGICTLPDSSEVNAWDFLKGKVGQEYSYCKQQAHEIKTVEDSNTCIVFMTEECAVCVLEDGREVEVTELMGLDFRETTCGDGNCGIPENYKTCPRDCPSGFSDAFCDGVQDGLCDLDCKYKDKDIDCPEDKLSSKCGNRICEETENYKTCPRDCPKPEVEPKPKSSVNKCGNGICDNNENYKSCLSDCPSGSSDRYCDGIEDDRCDPDCSDEDDTDCKLQIIKDDQGLPIIKIILASISLLLIASLIYFIFKKTKRPDDKEMNNINKIEKVNNVKKQSTETWENKPQEEIISNIRKDDKFKDFLNK